MDSPSPPPAPDPTALAQQQAQFNRVDQFTPYGNLTYSGPNRSTATMSFSPEMQGIHDARMGVSRELLANALTKAGNLPTSPIGRDFSADAAHVEQATFDRARGLLDPVFATERRRLEQQMFDQGLPMGSEAFGSEFDRFDTRQDEAYLKAALDSVGAGRQEHSRLFGMDLTARQSELNELAAVLNGQQVQPAQLGGFFAPGAVDVTGPAQMAYQGQMAGYNAAQQNRSNMMSGLFGLGSAFLLA